VNSEPTIKFDPSLAVLVADDVALMQGLLKGILKSIGIPSPTIVSDGRSALNTLRSKKFDLVIADWNMPGLTGLELLRRMRNDDNLRQIPFLMLTAEGESSYIDQAMDAGASGFLSKPVSRNTLLIKLAEIYTPTNT
jgi:two-component system chemotaxis response regulator CheY